LAERGAEDEAKRKHLHRGPVWWRSLVGDYALVARLVSLAGGEADPAWPVRVFDFAETIVDVRVRVQNEEAMKA
jgi:hypothetical protein